MRRYDDPADPDRTADALTVRETTIAEVTDEADGTEEIRVEIEQTRAEMSETLDAIQSRLAPDHIKEQARDVVADVAEHAKEAFREVAQHAVHEAREQAKVAVRDVTEHAREAVREATIGRAEHMVSEMADTTRDVGSGVLDVIRENPIPAALAAVSLGWLFMRRPSGGRHSRRHDRDYGEDRYGGRGRGERYYYPGRFDRGAYRDDDYYYEGDRYGAREAYGYPGGRMERAYDTPPDYGRRAGRDERGGYSGSRAVGADYDREDAGRGVTGRVSEAADQVGERASEVVDQVKERAGDVAETASEVVSQAGERAGEVVEYAGEILGGVPHRARGAGSGLLGTVRRNPLPSALAAIGIGWLLFNRQGEADEYDFDYAEDLYHEGDLTAYSPPRGYRGYRRAEARQAYGYEDYGTGRAAGLGTRRGQTAGAEAGGTLSTGNTGDSYTTGEDRGTVSRAAEAVGDAAGEIRDRAEDVAQDVQESAGDVARQARHQVRRARGQLEQLVQDNPLALGATALALGAAVGLALPRTEQEDQLLGEVSDHVLERAQDVAQEAAHRVERVVDEAQDAVKREAREQGLTETAAGSGSTGRGTQGSSDRSGALGGGTGGGAATWSTESSGARTGSSRTGGASSRRASGGTGSRETAAGTSTSSSPERGPLT